MVTNADVSVIIIQKKGGFSVEGKTEFVIFCIENLAVRLQENAAVVYNQLAKQSRILYDYIIPNYEILHSQGKEYILDDLIEVMQEEGVLA